LSTLLIENLGSVATGLIDDPLANGDSILITDGTITGFDGGGDADTVIDAKGLYAAPGLIDSHVHPIVGDVSVVPKGAGWLGEYLEGGVTSCVSAGEMTTPGFVPSDLSPELCVGLAETTARMYKSLDVGTRVYAGTLVLVPGLVADDFRSVADAGGLCVKYVYYPFSEETTSESDTYRDWAHDHGLVVKLHSGGTSYLGSTIPVGRSVCERIRPDVVCHLNGGPIPMSDDDAEWVVRETASDFEVIMGGNLRLARDIVRWAVESDSLGRLLCGTDTPGGSGITPRAMLWLQAFLAGSCGLSPETALAAATGNVARAHGIESGRLEPGRPADLILLGAVRGSAHGNAWDALRSGEIPAVATVIKDGRIRALPGRFTPPPSSLPVVTGGVAA
jgi:enamidase